MIFKKGDYVYYYFNGDNFPCVVLQVKKRVKITDSLDFVSWVSPLSLTHQGDSDVL